MITDTDTEVQPAPDLTSSTVTRTLANDHRAELHASGLTDETIGAAGIYTGNNGVVNTTLGWRCTTHDLAPAIVFPYGNGYARIKPDHPRHDECGKVVKYESPRGKGNQGYLPPGFTEQLNAGGTIAVTEGEKKALAVAQLGIACIGLVGVWGFQQKRFRTDTGKSYGERRLIDDLDRLEWKGREVVIVFDSDAATNDFVRFAEVKLAELLKSKGASVKVARIPAEADAKVGADDFIVKNGADAFRELLTEAKPAETPPTPGPMDWARMIVNDEFTSRHGVTLRWHRDEFYAYRKTHYAIVPDAYLSNRILQWLDERGANAKPSFAGDVLKCLGSEIMVSLGVELPSFLDERREQVDPRNIIAVRNGLLDITNIGGDVALYDHTPVWFSTTSLPFDFDLHARCPQWEGFLADVFDGDAERITLLQQYAGLLLVADTSYQKLLLLIGPRRSGKGTTVRILAFVLGAAACVFPRLSSLASNFGLWPLVGKSVAICGDAHLGHRTDSMLVLETLKSIVGEDSVTVERKFLPPIDCRLGVRFVLTANEMPRFSDASDALGARLLVLPFEKSYAGREDRTLETRLKAEASGVLNWMLRGLYSLRHAGRFIEPGKSQAVLADYRRLSAPVTVFLEERCVVDGSKGTKVGCDVLYSSWCEWTKANGYEPGAIETFGSHLRAAEPGIHRARSRADGERGYFYFGVRLKDADDE